MLRMVCVIKTDEVEGLGEGRRLNAEPDGLPSLMDSRYIGNRQMMRESESKE